MRKASCSRLCCRVLGPPRSLGRCVPQALHIKSSCYTLPCIAETEKFFDRVPARGLMLGTKAYRPSNHHIPRLGHQPLGHPRLYNAVDPSTADIDNVAFCISTPPWGCLGNSSRCGDPFLGKISHYVKAFIVNGTGYPRSLFIPFPSQVKKQSLDSNTTFAAFLLQNLGLSRS